MMLSLLNLKKITKGKLAFDHKIIIKDLISKFSDVKK